MQGVYEGYKQNGKFFNVTVDGSFVGFGMDHPEEKHGLSPGDVIEFETYKRGNFTNADTKTLKKVSSGNGTGTSSKAANGSSGSSGMNKGEYWDKKEARDLERQTVIEHQSSRNAAIEMVNVLLTNGYVSTPTKKADQYDFAMNLVDKITRKFNTDVEACREYGLATEDDESPKTNDNVNDELDG